MKGEVTLEKNKKKKKKHFKLNDMSKMKFIVINT